MAQSDERAARVADMAARAARAEPLLRGPSPGPVSAPEDPRVAAEFVPETRASAPPAVPARVPAGAPARLAATRPEAPAKPVRRNPDGSVTLTGEEYSRLFGLALRGFVLAALGDIEDQLDEPIKDVVHVTETVPGKGTVNIMYAPGRPVPARLIADLLAALDALGRPAMPAELAAGLRRAGRRVSERGAADGLRYMRKIGLVGFDEAGGYTAPED